MAIPFKQIPNNLRTPFFFGEVSNAAANTSGSNQRALMIGQMLASGSGVANQPVISAGVTDAKTLYGQGSILAQMIYNYRQNDPFGEVWCLPLADAGGAVAATGTITFTAANT